MIVENTENYIIATADTGMIFKSKFSGDLLTSKLYLGCNDSIDRYEEVNEVEAYAEAENDTEQTKETEYEDGVL